MLIDEICHAVGDEADDIDWYVKRTVLGGIYSTTELYMLTDNSPGSLIFLLVHFVSECFFAHYPFFTCHLSPEISKSLFH